MLISSNDGRNFKKTKMEQTRLYKYRQSENTFIVSVANRAEISKALTAFCEEQNIAAGTITGLGAVDNVVLRFFDPATKKYVDKRFDEQMEISNLTGNVTRMNGKVYLHIHITLGRADYTALAGHLLTATLNGAGEFVIEKSEVDVERYYDETTGINMYKF